MTITPLLLVLTLTLNQAPDWHNNYDQAYQAANDNKQRLLIHFTDTNSAYLESYYQDPSIQKYLKNYTLAKLPTNYNHNGTPLLQHRSMAEMLGKSGIAILDLTSSQYQGNIISVFPTTYTYNKQQLLTILTLPKGSLTQRTLIYAIRTHPEHPQSARGEQDPYLAEQARSHSQHQANITLQGHHNWNSRFHTINAHFGASAAQEICAESWGNEPLLQAAIECVRCWRISSGHWSAARATNSAYGYDIKRGRNRIWYATGIFHRRR